MKSFLEVNFANLLYEKVVKLNKITAKAINEIVDELFEYMADLLNKGYVLDFRKIARIYKVKRKQRKIKVRDKEVIIPEQYSLRIKPSKKFKRMLNENINE